MTFWESPRWLAYERAYGDEPGARVDELAASDWKTHVIDLSLSEAELWANIPKTMRQAIRKGEAYRVNGCAFQDYRELHIQASGGTAPRSSETYRLQSGWVRDGHALLSGAYLERAPVAACFVIRWQGWAYYASGPSLKPHVMPRLIWRAMLECKRFGDRWFEVGWLHGETEKQRSIAAFKARWGGENKPANWLALEAACASSA